MKIFLSVIVICMFFLSCARDGLGGKATVVVYPQFLSVPVINHVGYSDTVYVKFNTTDLPGTTPKDYDTYFVGSSRSEYITCAGLKWGDYFFYCAGFDSSILSRVTGGAHVKIRQHDRKKTENVNITLSE